MSLFPSARQFSRTPIPQIEMMKMTIYRSRAAVPGLWLLFDMCSLEPIESRLFVELRKQEIQTLLRTTTGPVSSGTAMLMLIHPFAHHQDVMFSPLPERFYSFRRLKFSVTDLPLVPSILIGAREKCETTAAVEFRGN